MSEHSTDQLAALVAGRRQCLLQMRDLGQKQAELIATGEMDPLLRLLAAKQQLLTALQTMERNLAPYHDQDPEQRIWTSPEARVQCSRQAADCKGLLEEIMQLEKQNEQRITLRRDEVASQLQTVHTASMARGAYQAQQTSTPRAWPRTAPQKATSTTVSRPSESTAPGKGLDFQR
jgi:hypothetical protein